MTFNISKLLFDERTPDLMSDAAVAEADKNTQDGMKAGDEDKLVLVRKDMKLAMVVHAPKGLRTPGTYVYPFRNEDNSVSVFQIGDRFDTDYEYAVKIAKRLCFIEKLGVPLLPLLVKYQESQNKSLSDYLDEYQAKKEKALYTYRKESVKLTVCGIRYYSNLWCEPAKPQDNGIDLKTVFNQTATLALGRLKADEGPREEMFLQFIGKKGEVLVEFSDLRSDFFKSLADALKLGNMALSGGGVYREEVATELYTSDRIFVSREEKEDCVFLVVERDVSLTEAYRLFFYLTKDQTDLLMSGCRHLAEISDY